MLIEHQGSIPEIDSSAYVAPNATICGNVSIGRGTRIMFGACIVAEGAPITIGENCIVMESAVIRSTRETGMGSRVNTIMQVCFFAISKVLPRDEAIEAIRQSIRHTYGRKGEDVVQKNMKAVDETLAHLFEVKVPENVTSKNEIPAAFPGAPKFEHDV